MTRLRLFAVFMLAALAAVALGLGPAHAERRLALVVGNDAYANVPALKKAVNDAEIIGKTLGELGFEVTSATNVDRRDFNRAISRFIAAIAPGDTAMFFYAGHGVEIEGKNYLLPVDVPSSETAGADFIAVESISVDDLLARLKERQGQLNLVVLDACRNNPFGRSGTRSLGSAGGLARITAPQGTFVMYSADVGETALDRLGEDDTQPNSVFTRTLVPLMKEPGRDLVDTAREVRRRVRDLALTIRHQQTPAYYDAVLGDFYFVSATSGEAGDTGDKQQGIEQKNEQKPADQQSQEQALLQPKRESPKEIVRQDEAVPEKLAPLGRALVVTGGEKDSIRLWDPDLQLMAGELEGEKIVISTLKITGGGRTLAVAGADGALFSYSIPAFKKKNALYPGFRVTAIAEAPDGALVLGGQDGTMAVIEAGSFAIRWRERNHAGIVSPILVSQSGETVVTASEDGTIAETRLSDGKVSGRVKSLPGKEITDIAYLTPAIVAAVHEDGTVAQINIATGKVLAAFKGSKGWISSVETLSAGQYVTAGVDGSLSFWAVGSDRPLRLLRAHSDVASGAKLLHSQRSDFLISAGFDGALKLWSQDASRLLASFDHGSAILHFDLIDAPR